MGMFDWFRSKKRSLDWSLPEHGIAIQGVAARVVGIPKSDHEILGRLVREEWIAWAKEQPNPKPSWLVPLEELSESDKEVDQRIGVRLANVGRYRYVDVG